MFVGGLLSAISCLTSAFVGSVDILILTYGVIGGTCMVNFCLRSKNVIYDVVASTWPRGYKTFFMPNSIEHEIFPAHKY